MKLQVDKTTKLLWIMRKIEIGWTEPTRNSSISQQATLAVYQYLVIWLKNASGVYYIQMGSLLSFYCWFFATQIIGGAKELVVLLWLSGNI